LYNNLIIVFSHPPDNQPARHQPDGSAANASRIARPQPSPYRQFWGPAPARPLGGPERAIRAEPLTARPCR